MKVIFYILGFFFIFHGLYQLIKYFIVLSRCKRTLFSKNKSKSEVQFNNIVILLPVLHEEKTIEPLLKNLSRQDYPKEFFEICIITTQKEYLNSKRPNTIDILDKLIPKRFPSLNISRIHYTQTEGFKADQLNFAFTKMSEEYGTIKILKSFFLLIDADAKLDANTLKTFNENIDENIEVYQQPSLRIKNIATIEDPLMRSFAFMQSFFAVSYELPMFVDYFYPKRLKYLVGHGLLIKGSFLSRIGGFPKIIEDVRLGRLCSFLDIKVKLIPGFGIVETAKNFRIYTKQSSVWYFGCALLLSDYLVARRLRSLKKFRFDDIIIIIYGFFKAFRWLNKGLIHLIGIIFSIIYRDIMLFILSISSLLLNSSIPVLCFSKTFKETWQKNLNKKKRNIILLESAVFAPLMYLLNFIGLYLGLIKIFNFYLWGRVSLPKTER